jgi:DNA-directed RNA polymerase subunit omega
MAEVLDTMMDPPVEELLERCESKFSLVTLAAKRARQINSYYGQLGDGLGHVVPPQVTSKARKALSIAFEEITEDKIEGVGGASGRPLPESMRPVVEGSDDTPADGA